MIVQVPCAFIGVIWFCDFLGQGSDPDLGLGKHDDTLGVAACALSAAAAAEGFAIIMYEEIRKSDRIWHVMLVHHIVVCSLSYVQIYYNRISMLSIAGLATELSTIPLNLIGLLDHRDVYTSVVKYSLYCF